MLRTLTITAALAISAPAFAQVDHSKMDHSKMDHSTASSQSMDHGDMDHGTMHGDDHAHHDTDTAKTLLGDAAGTVQLANQPELRTAVAAGGEPIVANVLGAVCDFCATAMNKTFGKRDEVAATYVDLDAKTLNIVLKPGASLSDEDIMRTVKKAGYRVETITRGAAVLTN